MSESKEPNKKLSLSTPRQLEPRTTVETGQVRQSFSRGRSKAVMVVVRKKRALAREGTSLREVVFAKEIPAPAAPEPPRPLDETRPEPQLGKARLVLRSLTEGEKATRARALDDANRDADEARRRAEDDFRRRAEEEEVLAVEHEAAVRRAADEAERKRKEDEARRKAEEKAAKRLKPLELGAETADGPRGSPVGKRQLRREGEAEPAVGRGRPKRRGELRRPAPARRMAPRRRGKLTVGQALSGDERVRSLAAARRQREKLQAQQIGAEPPPKVFRDVVVPETITVQELANRMAERGADVVKSLFKMGVIVNITQSIDGDTAELIVAEFGHRVKRVSEADVESSLQREDDEEASLRPRAPVVTVMGHVDHGKTSLLDALRQTDVAGGVAGGITQHIGAYQVEVRSGAKICFIDTPGHEAFSQMRARGANVTDIVVLVVAADDGVKPQTVEAIDHAKAAKVPIVVAINKIDRGEADPTRVRRELLEHGIVVEDLGGDVLSVEVSAKEKTNLNKLEEMILLQAELLDLKANPNRAAEGAVIEARLDSGRGAVATMLVRRGTLKAGDIVVAGPEWGRARALIDDRGGNIKQAGPSTPVELLGLSGTPEAGDEFAVVDSEGAAREVAEFRQRGRRQARAAIGARGTLEQMFSKIQAGEAKELPIVIKADVHGTGEAIAGALKKLGTDEVAAQILHVAAGGINESDVTLAQASDALIVGFSVRANAHARALARREKVDIRYYSVIYEVVDDIKAMLSGMLEPAIKENVLGNAEVREVFSITKVGKVAGCRVKEGSVRRGAKVRLLRDDVVIHEGQLATLKRFKEEVKEVRQGFECGIGFENYQDIRVGDIVEAYELEEIARAL